MCPGDNFRGGHPVLQHQYILISIIGTQTYAVIRSLVASKLPQSKSLEELIQLLKEQYEPKPLVIAERYRFHIHNQACSESVAEYVAELRGLASSSVFGAFLDEALGDCFVCGLRNNATRRKLLTKLKLTFVRAVELAQSIQQVDKYSKSFHTGERDAERRPEIIFYA